MRLQKREREELNKFRAEALRKSFDDPSVNRIAVDCSFRDIMDEFERSSLAVQLQQCYSHLRVWGKGTLQMHITSVDAELQSRIKKQGGDQWVVHLHSDSIETLTNRWPSSRVIVMSPDATEELTVDDLKSAHPTLFILGGIVDRRVSRNETCHKAIRLGLQARRLPIDSERFLNKVFNIDSVFLFLVRAILSPTKNRDGLIRLMEEIIPERKKMPAGEPDRILRPTKQKDVSDPGNEIKLDRYSALELLSR